MSNNIAVSLIKYKRPDQYAKCIESLKYQRNVDIDFYVQDNDKENLYCGSGYNEQFRHWLDKGNPDIMVMVTQDCYLKSNCLINLIAFMDKTPKCGIAGVKQVAEDGDTIVHGGCTIAYPAGHHIGGKKSNGDCNENKQMPWVNGSVMCIRKQCLQDIGLFDPRMKLIGIESDLCYRARAFGWEVWYCADAECEHVGGGVSSKPSSQELVDIMVNDMLVWRKKWVGSEDFAELSYKGY